MFRNQGVPGRLLLIFGAASLAAVGVGAAVCAASGIPAALWIRNLAGWGVGALAAIGLAAAYRPIFLPVFLIAAPVGLAATFLGADQLGVHRWIGLGPLNINAAMLLLPAAVVALAGLAPGHRLWPWLAALLALALLVAQPDASQATSFAAPMVLLAAFAANRLIVRIALITAAVVLAAAAWFRPDPLAPVPEVEEVIGLAYAVSPVAAVLAALLMVAAAAAPIFAVRRRSAAALTLCLVSWAAMTMFGAFPAPFVGIGLSPILGAWLGVGLLAGRSRPNP